MDKIKNKYDATIAKITKRIDGLRSENEKDQSKIVELEKAYALSVIEDDGLAAKARKKLQEYREAVAEREEQIELLEAGTHPVMVQAANDAAVEYAKEYEKHKAKGEKSNKDLAKAKARYISAVASASIEDQQNAFKREEIRHILKNADVDLLECLDIAGDLEGTALGGINGGGAYTFFSPYDFQVNMINLSEAEREMK